MNKVKSLLKARWMSSLIFLLLLFLITGIAEPEFLSYSNIISCFNTATMYTLLAIGIAFVIMTGEIDVSIGSTLGLSAAMTGLIAKQDGSIAVMLLAVVATGAVIGLVNGVGVAYFGVPSLIFTLGTNSVVRGMIYILSDGRTVENFGGSLASYGNLTLFAEITLYYAIAILLVAVAHIVLTKTRKGKYFIAVGDNAGGANLVGISVTGTKLLAYVLCGVFAGLGGFVFASKYGQVMTVAGNGYEMTAIAACVPLTIPRMLGYELYTVVSGSMEPAIPTGSLVYVENMDPTEVQEGDVIAFYSVQGGSAVITHRVVTNSTVMGEFITKGDANEENDMSPIPYYYFIGRVVKSIPRVGSMAQTFTSSTGKLAAASLMGLGVILHLMAAVLNRKREKEA